MSVHQESVSAHGAHAHEEVAVESEITSDMIKLLLTALGGAIIGTLLTLLILSTINGGTLRYGGGASRLDKVELAYEQLSANVGTNTDNMKSQNEQFATDISSINEIVTGHSRSINQMAPMVARTSANSDQSSALMSALEEAFAKSDAATRENELVVSEVGSAEADDGPMMVFSRTEGNGNGLPVGMVAILPFVDENFSGLMDPGETNEAGITASLFEGDEVVATLESSNAGLNFTDIEPGRYDFVIEDGGEFDSLAGQSMEIEVGRDDEHGQLIYLGIAEDGAAEAAAAAAEAEASDADSGDNHAGGDADAEHASDDEHGAEAAEGEEHVEGEVHDEVDGDGDHADDAEGEHAEEDAGDGH